MIKTSLRKKQSNSKNLFQKENSIFFYFQQPLPGNAFFNFYLNINDYLL